MSLDAILQELVKLSPSELEQVRNKVNALRSVTSVGTGSNKQEDQNPIMILDAICHVMDSTGVEHTYPNMLMRGMFYKGFKDRAPGIFQFLKDFETKTEKRAALNLCVKLLYDDITGMGYPCSSRTLMKQIGRIPAVVNKNFPGYVQSGYLHKILESHVSKR